MSVNAPGGRPENPIQELFLELIIGIYQIDNFSGNIDNLPTELKRVIQQLQQQGVKIPKKRQTPGLLYTLIDEYNTTVTEANHLDKTLYTQGVSERVLHILGLSSETPELSEEAQKVQKKFDAWIEKNRVYADTHKIIENVKITNDGIELGGQILRWKGHQFGGVKVASNADLEKQPYTIEEIGSMIQVLGGKPLKRKEEHQLGGPKVSSFLSEVANIELGRFYLSSSPHFKDHYNDPAWGVHVDIDGVYVDWYPHNYNCSSFSSQN